VIVAAAGVPGLVKAEWLKEGVVAVDVGINFVEGSLTGDIEFTEEALKKVSMITPVPGGVGPMTVAMLMQNVVSAHYLF
jgi:5,10-methylene-tetrahydrofolate dehydrogenase/methenyl tetrahydrofolate cyclohydrolase